MYRQSLIIQPVFMMIFLHWNLSVLKFTVGILTMSCLSLMSGKKGSVASELNMFFLFFVMLNVICPDVMLLR